MPEVGVQLLRHFGLTTLKSLKALGASSESGRECVVNGLGFSPQTSPQHQLALIKLLVVWDSANHKVLAESPAQAVAATLGQPVPMGGYESTSQPDVSYLGLIKTILRVREPRAEALRDVKNIVDAETPGQAIVPTGQVASSRIVGAATVG